MRQPVILALTLTLVLATLSTTAFAKAPEPAKTIDPTIFYNGRWIEIGRRPMFITNRCVAGTTDYRRTGDLTVAVVDGCHRDTPAGKPVTLTGQGIIMDPGTNAKLRVRYNALITWDYWVLDRADDYSWFISADPNLKNLWIYTRTVPSPILLKALMGRARALGYDTDKLEFPAPPIN
jgi:apolipoprotein D and lipocalin family protein